MFVYVWAGFLLWLGTGCLLAGRQETRGSGWILGLHLTAIASYSLMFLLLEGLR